MYPSRKFWDLKFHIQSTSYWFGITLGPKKAVLEYNTNLDQFGLD
jgi:hypothetical protein